MNTVNLVVTCTKKKTREPGRDLMLRHLRGASTESRAAAWLERLDGHTGERLAARDLYAGDHWSIAKELDGSRLGRGSRVRVWVASAGYGLLSMDNPLQPYSATFAVNHPDSVVGKPFRPSPLAAQRGWWRLVTNWAGPWGPQPRCLADLAREYRRSPLVVVASEIYLRALRDDLADARQALADPSWMSIISAGTRRLDGLQENMVACDARLQSLVGGARRSLNIRLTRHLLQNLGSSLPALDVLNALCSHWLASAPDLKRYDRRPRSDQQVRRFIARILQREPSLRPTPLLRRLRDEGYACEYGRFMKLFRAGED